MRALLSYCIKSLKKELEVIVRGGDEGEKSVLTSEIALNNLALM